MKRTERPPTQKAPRKSSDFRGPAGEFAALQSARVGDEGLRQNGATGFNYRLKTTSKKSMGAQVGAKISLSQVVACRRICSATYFTVISFKFPVLEAKVSVSTPRFCSMVTNRLQSGWLRSRLNARCWPWRKPPPASRMGRLVVS